MRYFATVAYSGTNYHGWQQQKNAVSVQETIADSFSTVLREKIEVTGSGRTDTGVHASQQVFHFDTEKELDDNHIFKFNSILPNDIAIEEIRKVNAEAHARFDASSREYEYHINERKNPFLQHRSYYYTQNPDLDKMNEAAKEFLRFRDFESFSKVKTDVNHFECDISKAFWKRDNDLLIFHVSSNRFLRGMVRTIVGTLLDVGSEKQPMMISFPSWKVRIGPKPADRYLHTDYTCQKSPILKKYI